MTQPRSVDTRNGRLFAVLLFSLVAGFATVRARQGPPNARDTAPATQVAGVSMRPGDWTTYNGPLSGDRYSPLTQITAANVGQIRQVCAFDAPEAVNFQSGIVAV